jgi:uncharacterized membrane protein (DUF373 family)
MKYILITLVIGLSGCSTMKCAKTDFTNFSKTLELNSTQDKVYFLLILLIYEKIHGILHSGIRRTILGGS